jgi:hypothetical protein
VQQVTQLPQQRGHAAGRMEVLHVAFACRLQIHQHWRGVGQFVQSMQIDRHAASASKRGQVDQRVG